MNNDQSFEIRENVFTYYIPVPAALLVPKSRWGYILLLYTRQIWSQFSVIHKVFLLIFSAFPYRIMWNKKYLYNVIFPIQKQSCIYIYINKSKRLQIIIHCSLYRGWWTYKNVYNEQISNITQHHTIHTILWCMYILCDNHVVFKYCILLKYRE